jgi:hypothetical protein
LQFLNAQFAVRLNLPGLSDLMKREKANFKLA